MLYSNDKRINLTGRCSSKCANTKQCLEIYGAKSDRYERRKRQIHHYSWGLQHYTEQLTELLDRKSAKI